MIARMLPLIAVALTSIAAAPPSLPVLPVEQVARATALLRLAVLAKVKNGTITPRWLAGQDVFWYARDIGERVEFTLVDAATGVKRVAFDHAAVAAAAALAASKPVDPAKLAVTAIDGAASTPTVTVSVAGTSYACATAGPVVCTVLTPPDPALLPAPDGRQALFVRDGNLWVRDGQTHVDRALTTDGTADDGYGITPDQNLFQITALKTGRKPAPFLASWSPDGRTLIVPRIDQRHVAPYPYVENAPSDGTYRPKAYAVRIALMGEELIKVAWFAIDVATGARKPIDFPPEVLGDRTIYRIWWSADGRTATTLMQTHDLSALHAFRVDVASGAVRHIVADRSMRGRTYDLGGAPPPPARPLANGRELLWMTVCDGYDQLELRDAATGRVRNSIAPGHYTVREILAVDEAKRVIVFTANEREPGNPYHRYVYRASLDGGAATLITPDAGDHEVPLPVRGARIFDVAPAPTAVSPSGRYLVYTVSTVANPPVHLIRRIDSGALVSAYETADISALLASGYRPPEEVVTKAANGVTDLWGNVYRPSDYDPARKYAVIDSQYASPLIAITPRGYMATAGGVIGQSTNAATAELGFVVVTLDARGTPSRNRAFSDPAPRYLERMGLDDHIAFIREVARRDAGLDLDRVGINGISFGGWTAIRGLIEHPEFFKVGFAGAPPGSFASMWDAEALTIAQGPTLYAGKRLRPTPTAVADAFGSADNVRQVDRLRGKLLIAQGELDENVLPGSPLQFYDAAMKADKDVELLWVPGGTHGGIYSSYATRRTWEFFLANLNGTALPPGTKVQSLIP